LSEQTVGNTPIRVIFFDNEKAHMKQYAQAAQFIALSRDVPIRIRFFSQGCELLSELRRNETDAVIIIAEPDLACEKGLDTLRRVREQDRVCQIILLSEKDSYALEGYEVDALAYLIKGSTSRETFTTVFNRALDRVIVDSQEYITFSCAGTSQTLRLSDIEYFEVKRKIVTVHFEGGTFDFYSTLHKIEDLLGVHGFIQVHRSFIVALSKISRYDKDTIVLESGTEIPIGKNHRKDLILARKALAG